MDAGEPVIVQGSTLRQSRRGHAAQNEAFQSLLDERAFEAQNWPLQLILCVNDQRYVRSPMVIARTSG
eukprot:9510748-Heterocapsa_arctica.AAC.1